MDELTKKANEVKSRFSISSYYHSQVKDPTPEMLKQINAEIDPETGNVVKKKRVKKEAKTTVKKEKKAKAEKPKEPEPVFVNTTPKGEKKGGF